MLYHSIHNLDLAMLSTTGCGKTVCFAVLPFAFDIILREQGCIAIVVSPLIALMRDQVSWQSQIGLHESHHTAQELAYSY